MVETKDLNLYEKIAKIAKSCVVIAKNKKTTLYKYTSEDEILARVTAAMQRYNVSLVPKVVPGTLAILPVSYTRYDKKLEKELPVNEVIVSADMVYTWVNLDNTSEQLEVPWVMCGQKEDVSQAMGGALTYTNRYFLLKSLQMATVEDDPDYYRSKQQEAMNKIENNLVPKKKQIIEEAQALIASGANKDDLYSIIAKHNNGKKNSNSIRSEEVADKILAEFAKLKKSEKPKQTDKKTKSNTTERKVKNGD